MSLDPLFINNLLFNLLLIKRKLNWKLSMGLKNTLKMNLEFYPPNSVRLLEFRRKMFLGQPFINNTLLNLNLLLKIWTLNSKIMILFIELLLLNTMHPLIIHQVRKRLMIEPSKFPFSKMSELRFLLLIMFLNSMMFLFILRCPLLKILLKEMLRIFISILRIILRKLQLKKVIKRNQIVQIVRVEDVLVVLEIWLELWVMPISAGCLINKFN
jgi:hypothetical protein